MSTEKTLEKMPDVIRRKHFTLSTEQCYCAWLSRYCDFIINLPAHISSEQKLERFLTGHTKHYVLATIQNQDQSLSAPGGTVNLPVLSGNLPGTFAQNAPTGHRPSAQRLRAPRYPGNSVHN